VRGNEVCQALISISNASSTPGLPRSAYLAITRYLLPLYTDEELLGNATYVDEGSWNDETTYCFRSEITISEPLIMTTAGKTTIGSPITLIINTTKICILNNGVTASATVYEKGNYRTTNHL
jgi:hypothetical protein